MNNAALNATFETTVIKHKISEASSSDECAELMIEYLEKKGYKVAKGSEIRPNQEYNPFEPDNDGVTHSIASVKHEPDFVMSDTCVQWMTERRTLEYNIAVDMPQSVFITVDEMARSTAAAIANKGNYDITPWYNAQSDVIEFELNMPYITKPIQYAKIKGMGYMAARDKWKSLPLDGQGKLLLQPNHINQIMPTAYRNMIARPKYQYININNGA